MYQIIMLDKFSHYIPDRVFKTKEDAELEAKKYEGQLVKVIKVYEGE